MNTTQNPANPISALDTLIEQFTLWRNTRTSRRAATPKPLCKAAVNLLQHYQKTRVIKALGINSTILKRWQEDHSATATEKNTFIPLQITTAASPEHHSALEFTLTVGQDSVTVRGTLSPMQLAAVCQGLRSSWEASR